MNAHTRTNVYIQKMYCVLHAQFNHVGSSRLTLSPVSTAGDSNPISSLRYCLSFLTNRLQHLSKHLSKHHTGKHS